jgi:L-alanine-DL-glutamate epimerase-like enolase superfamily enzyme
MKIARVEAVPVRLPFTQQSPPIIAFGRPFVALEFCVVVVETDDGIVGYGETPWGPWRILRRLVDDFLAPAVVGRELGDVPALMQDLQRLVYVIGRYGLTMFALSGLDTALWDIAAKAAGVPLYRLLGGRAAPPVPGYYSVWLGYRRTTAWDWECSDRDMLAEQTRAAVEAGYAGVKLHGTADADLALVRDLLGDERLLMIDASCRWTLDQARAAAERLAQFAPHWLEEPIFPPEDHASLARLRSDGRVPIAAGENACTAFEFSAMLAAGAVDVAQPNVNRVGGVTEFRKVIELADRHGVALCPHSFFFGPGFLATLHLLAARGVPGLVERSGVPIQASLYGAALDPVDGRFRVPDGAGLGLDPDADVLRECRIRDDG